jgi:hypothetical protein
MVPSSKFRLLVETRWRLRTGVRCVGNANDIVSCRRLHHGSWGVLFQRVGPYDFLKHGTLVLTRNR